MVLNSKQSVTITMRDLIRMLPREVLDRVYDLDLAEFVVSSTNGGGSFVVSEVNSLVIHWEEEKKLNDVSMCAQLAK